MADEWVVVVEGKPERAGDSFEFCLVQDILRRLRPWNPSCVYHPRRYAIQLHIAAAAPSEALRNAVAYHEQAAQAVGLARPSLTRAEVLSLGEFQMGRQDETVVARRPPQAETRDGLISDVLYSTTRALLRVSTPAEISDLLVGFVTGVGGSVTVGDYHPVGGMVSVPLGAGNGEPLHAVAEALSAAGLVIERCLPALVEDAGRVMRQLRPAST